MDDEPPQKRFRYATYTQQINKITVDSGRVNALEWEENEKGEIQGTPFTAELERLALLDLTTPFIRLIKVVQPLATSLPITLHNIPLLQSTFHDFYAGLTEGDAHTHSGLDSVLQLHRALYETCLSEAVEYVPQTATDISRVASSRALEPRLVERAYGNLSLILRSTAPALLKSPHLGTTWAAVRPYLSPSNRGYVRRCIADAWVGVVRKARGESLIRLMEVMLEGETKGMEAIWAHSLKGAAGQLHSRALPIFDYLLDDLLAVNGSDEKKENLTKLVIALVHHTTSTTVVPIVNAISSRLAPTSSHPSTSRDTTFDFASSTLMLNLLSTLLLTRKGKRFPESLLKPTMLKLLELFPRLSSPTTSTYSDAEAEWRKAIAQAVIGSLAAGKLAQWLSPGVTVIEKFWDLARTEERFAFVNALIKLRWSGVEQFLIPHIARTVLPSLSQEPLPTLVLLNNLAEAGFLTGSLSNVQGGKWKISLVASLSGLLQANLDAGIDDVESRRILGQLLHLLPSIASEGSAFSTHTLAVIEQIRSNGNRTRGSWEAQGIWNHVHILSLALRAVEAFSSVPTVREELQASLLAGSLQEISVSWAWNREAVVCVAGLVELWQDKISEPWNLDPLYSNLISSDSSLRLSTLRILSVLDRRQTSTELKTSEIWALCRDIEMTEMTLKNVRERTNQIARLGRILASFPSRRSDEHENSKDVVPYVVDYLLSQLKVNFKPLYAETITALKEAGRKDEQVVWDCVWREIQHTTAAEVSLLPDIGSSRPMWASPSSNGQKAQSSDEEEAEFKCHNLEKTSSAISESWRLSSDIQALDHAEIPSQIPSDRLDVLNYEAQLLLFLSELPSLAEKHTRDIIPTFFAITDQITDPSLPTNPMQISTAKKQARTMNWLDLFGKFVNPKAAFRSAELHTLYLSVLSKGDLKLQEKALKCLMTFKSTHLVPYEENLKRLLEESKFRDELAHFLLGSDSEAISEGDRHEIIPVTIRILYGNITSRRGRGSAQGLNARKRAVLSALSGCSPEELKVLIDLMLETFETSKEGGDLSEIPGRQQLGFLSLLMDVLRYLAPQTLEHWPRLLNATLRLVGSAQRQIDKEVDAAIDEENENDEEQDDEEESTNAPMRNIRSAGIKRLVQFLRASVEFDFTPFLSGIFEVAITPRLDKLPVENTQAPSGTLDLIAGIALVPELSHALIDLDNRTLVQTFECLNAVKVKPAVVARVFDIIEGLLEHSADIVRQTTVPLLDNIIRYVDSRPSSNDDLTRRLLGILSKLSTIVEDGQQAQTLAGLLAPMLRQSGKSSPERTKVHILETLQRLYPISPDFADTSSSFFTRNYDLISQLFQTAYMSSTRRALTKTLQRFAESDPTLTRTIELVADLNAYSVKRLDEPDFDRRLGAFANLNDGPASDLPTTPREWSPILRSMLFFIKDPEELSIRTSASSTLKRFMDLVGGSSTGDYVDVINHVILPGLRQSLRSKLELVRNEALQTIAHGVTVCSGIPMLADMVPLLGDDEDVSFFFNITHIQVHRRARALRRLRETLDESPIRETTIIGIFLPILEHIIAGSTEITDHHLINEAINSVGYLVSKLRWGKYYGVLGRYLRLGSVKSPQQKLYVRTISSIITNFHFDLRSETTDIEIDETIVGGEEGEEGQEGNAETKEPEKVEVAVADQEEVKRISDVVLNRLLPSLSKFVSTNDETEDLIRIPLALPTVKLAHALPEDVAGNEIIRIITIVAQILRSKDQDTRDIARETIGKIAVYLGPDFLDRILVELQGALQRGPQKHVAAVVTHAILVLATSEDAERFSDLDNAVNDAVRISAEVIWGESGKDVTNEGFRTKMREVRGAITRGFDTIQLLSRLVSPAKIGVLLAPIREVMHASQAVKTMTQVDEALRRVAMGLNANSRITPSDLLSLVYSLVSGNSSYVQPKRKAAPTSEAKDAYRVEMKRNKKEEADFYHLNAHKFVSFGLDLFVTAFRRGHFDFEDVDLLARLGPLVNAIGNTLYSPTGSVLILGLKASAAICRCPVPQLEAALPVFVTNIFKIIKQAGGSAESEVSQTALKTLAVIIRDCKGSEISDNQLKYLLDIISPDLEETDRQAAIFTILRAIIARKFVVPEIYDLMGSVSTIMITSQSTHVQDSCRGLLMAFLLDYPQGKGRVKSQMAFLAQNLSYVHESGRLSVMEVLNAVFSKFSDDLVEEYADLFFVALTAAIANDDSQKCRTAAGALLQVLFGRLPAAHVDRMTEVLRSWIEGRDEQIGLASAAMAVYGLLVEGSQIAKADVARMVDSIGPVIVESATKLAEAESDESAFATSELVFELPHHALVATGKALKADPAVAGHLPLDAIVDHMLFPHDWVRVDATKTIAAVLDSGYVYGEEALLDIAKKGCLLLQSERSGGEVKVVDAKLADEVVKLLWNIGKVWAGHLDVNALPAKRYIEDGGAIEDEEEEEGVTQKGALGWLMSRLSFVARHLIVHRPPPTAFSPTHWTVPLLSILRFFAGMIEHLETPRAKRFLVHVLSPVYRILDDNGDVSAEGGPEMDELRQLATEVRDFVQGKVGTTEFSKIWEGMRRKTVEKREGRKAQKTKLAMSDPKTFAERRSKKGLIKKDSKKRRTLAFAEGRMQKGHVRRRE